MEKIGEEERQYSKRKEWQEWRLWYGKKVKCV
jgi:hypothetical protein